MGIGTTTPAQRLHVHGDVLAGNIVSTGTITGDLADNCSRSVKQDIRALTEEEASQALTALRPVHFAYKTAPDEEQLGSIAEDVPNLVATKDRKGVAPMDVAAVLTRVVQAQDATIRKQQRLLGEQQRRLDEAVARIERLERGLRQH